MNGRCLTIILLHKLVRQIQETKRYKNSFALPHTQRTQQVARQSPKRIHQPQRLLTAYLRIHPLITPHNLREKKRAQPPPSRKKKSSQAAESVQSSMKSLADRSPSPLHHLSLAPSREKKYIAPNPADAARGHEPCISIYRYIYHLREGVGPSPIKQLDHLARACLRCLSLRLSAAAKGERCVHDVPSVQGGGCIQVALDSSPPPGDPCSPSYPYIEGGG